MFGLDDAAIAAMIAEAAAAAEATAAATAASTAAAAGATAAGAGAGAGALTGGLLGAGATAGTGAAAADAALAGYGSGMLGSGAADGALLGAGADYGVMGAGAGGTGLTGTGTAAQAATMDAVGAELANPAIYQYATANVGAAAPGTGGAMSYVTPSVTGANTGMLGTASESAGNGILGDGAVGVGEQAGAYSDVAGEQYAIAHPKPPAWMGYAKDAGKAASTYSAVNGAMGGNAPPRPPPQGRPVYTGPMQPIAQQMQQPQDNQFLRGLLEQRRRAQGMLS